VMVRAVFLRHGAKLPATDRLEHDVSLDPAELCAASAVRGELSRRNSLPSIWICSYFAHAWQTAEALADATARVVRVCGLTPFSAGEGAHLRPMVHELDRLGVSIDGVDCIGFVGHEDRLSNIANEFLPAMAKISRLDSYLETVCLVADTLLDLDQRKGSVSFRLSRPDPRKRPT
jgi:phosphohistidine phosphatase SixA